MRIAGGLTKIIAAYLVACLVAGLGVALPFSLASLRGIPSPEGPIVVVVRAVMTLATFAFAFSFIPAAAIIAYAERRQIRAAQYYALAGALTGVLSFCLFSAIFAGAPGRWTGRGVAAVLGFAVTLFGSAGLVGGLAYWSIAGRKAGAYRAAA